MPIMSSLLTLTGYLMNTYKERDEGFGQLMADIAALGKGSAVPCLADKIRVLLTGQWEGHKVLARGNSCVPGKDLTKKLEKVLGEEVSAEFKPTHTLSLPLSVSVSVSLSLCLSICLSVTLYLCVSVSLLCVCVCLSVSLSVSLSLFLSLSQSVYVSVSLCLSLCVSCLCLSLSFSLSLSLSVCLSLPPSLFYSL